MSVETSEQTNEDPEVATVVESGARALASLSPSRAADFKTCPLLYRLRSIDRIPEPPTPDQARGTLVHAVLERLFDYPAGERTPETAAGLVTPQWQRLCEEQPLLAAMFDADPRPEEFLSSATELLGGYFSVEDPRRLEPAERESLVEAMVDDHLLIRGYIDRLDVLAGRRPAGGRLQDRRRAPGGVRGPGAVPAQVLRAGAVADTGCGAPVAAVALPQRRRGLRLLAGRRRTDPVRTQPGGVVAGHRARPSRTATSGPSRAVCATGARTRRSARRTVARRRPSRSTCRNRARASRPPSSGRCRPAPMARGTGADR